MHICDILEHTYICMDTYVYICMLIYVNVYIYIYYICTCEDLSLSPYIHIHKCTYLNIYVYKLLLNLMYMSIEDLHKV